MLDFDTPRATCAWCGRKNNASADIENEGEAPKPGDASACVFCTEVSVFTDTLALRQPTVEEATELYADPDIRLLRASLREFHRRYDIVDERST